MTTVDQIPGTAKEALQKWDSGVPVITVEMGAMGPSYEQCIHIAVFELIRLSLKHGLPSHSKQASKTLDRYLNKVDQTKSLALSMAQAACAKHLAYTYLRQGYGFVVGCHRNLRHIQVMRSFPKS